MPFSFLFTVSPLPEQSLIFIVQKAPLMLDLNKSALLSQ